LGTVLANVLLRGSSGQKGKRHQSGHLLAKLWSLLPRSTNQQHMMLSLLPNRAARKLSREGRVDQLHFQLGRSPLSQMYQCLLQLKRQQRSKSLRRKV